MSDAIGTLSRRQLHLTEIIFDVVHLADVKHQAAYAFSRLETTVKDQTLLEDDLLLLFLLVVDEAKPLDAFDTFDGWWSQFCRHFFDGLFGHILQCCRLLYCSAFFFIGFSDMFLMFSM